MIAMRLFILAVLLPASAAGPVLAQANDPNAIAQSLREVDEKMTNPDPDMRVAYLETIVAEGNARKTERAIRIAIQGQDESLRALGFRAYVASTGSIPFEAQLTPQEKQAIDAYNSRQSNATLPRQLQMLGIANGRVEVVFENAPLNSVRGFVKFGHQRLEYTMRGERLTFNGYTPFGNSSETCNWDMRPTKDLRIVATMACQFWARPIQMTASMY